MGNTEIKDEYVTRVQQARLHLLRKDWTQARRVLEEIKANYPADVETAEMWAMLREEEGRELRRNDPFKGDEVGNVRGITWIFVGAVLMLWTGYILVFQVPKQVQTLGWDGTVMVQQRGTKVPMSVRLHTISTGIGLGIGVVFIGMGLGMRRGIF